MVKTKLQKGREDSLELELGTQGLTVTHGTDTPEPENTSVHMLFFRGLSSWCGNICRADLPLRDARECVCVCLLWVEPMCLGSLWEELLLLRKRIKPLAFGNRRCWEDVKKGEAVGAPSRFQSPAPETSQSARARSAWSRLTRPNHFSLPRKIKITWHAQPGGKHSGALLGHHPIRPSSSQHNDGT